MSQTYAPGWHDKRKPRYGNRSNERRISLKNLGPQSRQWLAEIGIYTIQDLRNAGSITTYRILKERYPKRVSLNLLWGLEAAIRDIDWRELTETDKQELKKKLR
jgi:DNA transformation protein